MSQNNSAFRIENKISFLSSHNNQNRILKDRLNKNNEFNQTDIFQVNRRLKLTNSNFDKKKFFKNNLYDIQSNGNELKQNGNGHQGLYKKNSEEGKLSRTPYKNDKIMVKSLSKKSSDLNGESNILRNDSNFQKYNKLELNYKQKSKELTELKQENNYIRFQLEDLKRRNNSNNNIIKNNNYINNKGNKKNSANRFGHVRYYHIKLFSKKIGEDENKEKNSEEEIEDYIQKNEELKKKNEKINQELDKFKKILKITKNENDDLKQNLLRLNNAIKLKSQKNNNDNYEKNELNIKIYELNEDKDRIINELNNLKKLNHKINE